MIYAEHHSKLFPELSNALNKAGVSESVISIAREYLDTEKERDNSLLDKIPVQPVITGNGVIFELKNKFSKAVKHEIKTQELNERYVLLIHALFGVDCMGFLIDTVPYEERKKFGKKFKNILASRFGDKAEACATAVLITRSAYSFYNDFLGGRKVSPKVYVQAIDFAENNVVTIMLLCAYALDGIEVPQKQNIISKIFSDSDTKNYIKKAVETIKENVSRTVSTSSVEILALMEGAYFDSELKEIFSASIANHSENAVALVRNTFVSAERFFGLIEENPQAITKEYISYIINSLHTGFISKNAGKHIQFLAEKYPSQFRNALTSVTNIELSKEGNDIFKKFNPDYALDSDGLKEKTRNKIISEFADSAEIKAYLKGEKSLDEVKDKYLKNCFNYKVGNMCRDYYNAYGTDDFSERCIAIASFSMWHYVLNNMSGFGIFENPDKYADILFRQNVPVITILEKTGDCFTENDRGKKLINELKKHADEIAETDISKASVPVRVLYLNTLVSAGADKYKSQITALSDDKSKSVTEVLAKVYSVKKEWSEDVRELLSDKKINRRTLALDIIEKQGADLYKSELQTAFEKEKSEKLKVRISNLIGLDYEVINIEEHENNIVDSLTKGTKSKKISWLFENPYKSVKMADGSQADEKYIKALIMCYASMENGKLPVMAGEIAGMLNPKDVEYIANETFSRWISAEAPAKNKWVLYLESLHGGNESVNVLVRYIKEWSEHSRGAIASEAVRALAMNGGSSALLAVDSIARKFKNRQVKSSAEKALHDVAQELNITTEQLADKIVPDFEFDEKMCRVFDYGNRKFSVYITPSLEIEIFSGEKKIKNLPKAGVNDDKEKAEKAYSDFKDMKKQLKTAVTAQKARLEYVFMNNRKWTSQSWTELFVKNPVMHCFAVGLIWGVYVNDKPETTFRYMEDGSFTDLEENEYQLPENAEIGLVHPVELTEQDRIAWIQQLDDYEIKQPFPQLTRSVYRMTAEEKNKKSVVRFKDIEINAQTLLGRMIKSGWYRGEAQDGGCFYEFYRDDISRIVTDDKGNPVPEGYIAELKFSGMCIAGFSYDEGDVDMEELVFYKAGKRSFGKGGINIGGVPERYFSEIILQLTSILGTKEE